MPMIPITVAVLARNVGQRGPGSKNAESYRSANENQAYTGLREWWAAFAATGWGMVPMIAITESSDSLVGLIDRIVAATVFRAMRQTDTNLTLYERQYGASERSRLWAQRSPKEQE